MAASEELFDIQARLATIPHEPGCYLMRDRRGRIIYIGKAKDLKNRVRNYFQVHGDPRPFVRRLPRILGDIETIITASEKEALILENTLIKAHKPRYNVLLKDDKSFLSLRIDRNQRWPRVEVIRSKGSGKARPGQRQFGPYSSAHALRQTLQVLNKHFMLRTCPDHVLHNRSRPCLQYQIKRCPGPCVLPVDRERYEQDVNQTVMFLEGRGDELVERLRSKMEHASEALEFELAARYRDQIRAIEKVLERQVAVGHREVDRDAFGFYRQGDRLTFQILFIRRGRLEGAQSFSYTDQEFPDEELFSSFLNLYYNAGNHVPNEVLLPITLDPAEVAAFEELLGELAGHKVYVQTPQRGAKRALIETAQTNARHSFEEEHAREERARDLLEKLQARLKLKNLPRRIECYDISNLQGTQVVGSLVSFVEGEPAKNEYRHYKMRLVQGQDDFASMHEMLTRRLRKVADGDDEGPDLIVVDGGKGQLGQATAVLEDLGLHHIDVVSLAKSRVDDVGFDDPEVTRSPERVFLPGRKNPVVLRQNSAELYLLQRLRDEAHDFAIGFHKQLRRKATLRSSLDDIPGIGPKTKRALLRHFGSLTKIKAASLAALQDVEGVGPSTARAIFDVFHPPGSRPDTPNSVE
ncbi:excinuclease ABC subunit C [Lujinxingia litoralis]|uniref:UvrABC system protein C n=1 Tax=Lujinxingia litoralis TaxID=2211119 RepID=A0A328C9Q1_9DELT|nr:excinuclease ABC subunit UvrC [Lujinxingia litoralis]RAL22895.1 excinuclease ABC subunit C [Lujinxingia litoralis]